MSSELKGKRIIVTGAARGIGASAARAFVAAGARVAALDVNECPALEGARYFRCDVASRAGVNAAFAGAADWLGGLDALVNIAGVERAAPAEAIADADWDLMFDVNARGTLNTNQAAFEYLRAAGGGRILNFASAAGVLGMPGCAHYSAAKAAVLGWTRTVAKEWACHNITVNALAPGMWTPMYETHRQRMSADELAAHDRMMAMLIPLGGKLGDPDRDMAPVLVFLAGDGARFITGQTLAVDGGLMIP
ncbi:SDR family NAD(P)-dependent oxidoreductase [Paucibacter sp. R3-3]|uniref:SDR family NAD(P)-dependent oxidoreductase n=1 Tax=Roseateles agri TaxID=3098619 RepID=A0ABU5DPB2_9BURK|nr:SDR family NAD(P)-dependent oxidoreductase [Paucibacter sp. R3-3]MDY0748157.1 SDR family NAD(P)-dependent oxidoreductase [Paucibacter sp. R3-3]